MSGRNPVPREQAYEGVRAQNPPELLLSKVSPTAGNNYKQQIGALWVNTVLQISFQLVGSPGVWKQISN
jgi:hypothetical protein